MTVVREPALVISPDGRSALLELKDVAVIDQPKWPDPDAAARPARLSLRVQWKAMDEPADTEDAAKLFRFKGHRATVKMEASVEVPSLGFAWKSDPMADSQARFGIIGEEVNGRYYDQPAR